MNARIIASALECSLPAVIVWMVNGWGLLDGKHGGQPARLRPA
jgi:hypothetical protein